MSGGSYSYLCYNTDAEGVASRREELKNMAERLMDIAEEDNNQAAAMLAGATCDIIDMLERIDRAAGELSEVWHAVEWYDSNDWGRDHTVKVLEREARGLRLHNSVPVKEGADEHTQGV